jgi:tetratricopeptide (TPR) repeat protein
MRQGKLPDAAAEYAEAIRWRPNEHASHYGLGSAYAFGGQWEKAAMAFEQAAELSPSDLPSLYRWAALCFYTADQENYRRACRMLLDHFSQTENFQVADCTAKACALMPGFGGNATQVIKLADVAFAETKEDPARKWFEITKALVDYRAGNFQAAADIISQSAPSEEGFHRDALAFSILALAQHQLGGAENQSREALTKAQRIIATKMPKTERGETFGDDWHDWLHAQIICREAEQLLKTPATSMRKSHEKH